MFELVRLPYGTPARAAQGNARLEFLAPVMPLGSYSPAASAISLRSFPASKYSCAISRAALEWRA